MNSEENDSNQIRHELPTTSATNNSSISFNVGSGQVSTLSQCDYEDNVDFEFINFNNENLEQNPGCDRNELSVEESVKELIKAKKYEIVNDVRGSAHKKSHGATVWSVFGRIRNCETNELIGYTICRLCDKLVNYSLEHFSTSQMNRHSCYKAFTAQQFEDQRGSASSSSPQRERATTTPRRLDFSASPAKSAKRTRQMNSHEQTMNDVSNLFQEQKVKLKKEVTESIVKWVTKDIRPFDIVESQNFIALAQTFIDIGAKFGSVSAADIVPSDTTVSACVNKLYNETKARISPEILEAISSGSYASFN